jgi:hypothetical protein
MNIEIKNHHYSKILKDGIWNAPKDKKYVALHVCSSQMYIFCEYYDHLHEIKKAKGYELVEPQCYSNIIMVYDLVEKEMLFYDLIGMVFDAHDQWEEQKDQVHTEIIYTPSHKNPLEKDDHFCQYDTGSDACYFCGEKKPN